MIPEAPAPLVMPRHELDATIAQLEAAGDVGPASLLRAARSGTIGLIALPPRGAIPRKLWWYGSPLIIAIGDNLEGASGPDCFVELPFVLKWARAAILAIAPENAAVYAAAIETTRARRRVALVETTPQRAPAWAAVFRAAGVTICLPPLPERAP